MDTSRHTMSTLFAQLGLDNDPKSIDGFVKQHRLPDEMLLSQAPFWNEGQRHFIEESLREDADWSEVIDELDAMLR
ncbi:DUF2789 domain-containing protein [Pseudoalteromonas sp. McH1-7]|uniref:DUF2789 domain-containing protein n=1 Tax=Pseudoalteromonas peptidolytica F12-50-A1 TaxID=1315280 RepID=A0A8I0MUR1_9GAMM|nr:MULTISPECIES: DUF2789 domain-containing protein [Pseudoalteromonas]MBE0345701.1 hypothetical protein [Pseudoalteromonas peptidolytica F12-50-A1]MDW7547802.1 DUF2789 domain-containing protein [Pseudoalteromonas peptidolytica]NLR14321.1 DUF2789 domain-containing protein [Pseudoalteromonas peptidolytica]NUZ11348.1 DUF2789 domain-containing protein [Pseudoalteromonas sp. McH1-7]RRS08635.1 DUF2789 domain-containing protein [Pseudoalteromonas sp. J010]